MRPIFHPRLVNRPFDDPGLFVPFLFDARALLFDCGENPELSSRDILKISHIFISHTHMDHFFGFDRIIRLCLGRNKSLFVFGPENFLKNMEGKLSAYSWNLVENYANRFSIIATEIHPDHTITAQYDCGNRFNPGEKQIRPFEPVLVDESMFRVKTAILDHDIPCLGFALKEKFHVNINKESLNNLGIEVGPWLKDFKKAVHDGIDPDSIFPIYDKKEDRSIVEFRLGELMEKIAIITPGQKIGYITDVSFSDDNVKKIVALVEESDHLFIEATFLHKDRELAKTKRHLTAKQAGVIARKAGAKRVTLMHHSPRYIGMEDLFSTEADLFFRTTE